MNIICGLPRSGSTLLCNILNQNPKFHATSTSPLGEVVTGAIGLFSQAVETKGQLLKDQHKAEARIKRAIKAMCDAYHHEHFGKVVFDKQRCWAYLITPLLEMYPDAKIIVTVRDLRDVFASVEKQDRKTPMLSEHGRLKNKTLATKLDRMFSDKGGIGFPLLGVKDMLLRQHPVFFVKYEDLAANPQKMMEKIYCYLLEEEPFEHQFENVEDTSDDPDGMFLYKYPHEGSGKVQPSTSKWQEFFRPEVAEQIMKQFKWFNEEFGYQTVLQEADQQV